MSAPPWSDRLSAAKLWIITTSTGNLPYLASAVYALVTVPTERIESMATDRHWRVYVNPGWLDATDVPQIGRSLVHHMWHLLADHAGRADAMEVRRATQQQWRTAADVSVQQVVPWRDAALPTWQELRLRPDRSAEEYFAALSGLPVPADDDERDNGDGPGHGDQPDGSDEPDASCGSGCDGIARSYEASQADPDVLSLDTHVADSLRRHTAIAFREHCRAIGQTPQEWGRWVAGILDPVVPWQQVLHAAVRRGIGWGQGHADYTHTRISRRQASAGRVVLPALRRPIPAVAVIIDTSGSIDDGLLTQALAELDAVLASLAVPSGSVTTLAVDSVVKSVSRVRDASAVRLTGGGGTDMGAGIEGALATRPPPQLIVVLTDGYTPWPTQPAPVPVIAAVLGRDRAELPPTPDWMQRVEVVPER